MERSVTRLYSGFEGRTRLLLKTRGPAVTQPPTPPPPGGGVTLKRSLGRTRGVLSDARGVGGDQRDPGG